MAEDHSDRLRALRAETEKYSLDRLRSGRWNYAFAYGLLLCTIAFSGAASIAGFLDQRPELVGVLALLPGLLTLTATQLKLQGRSNWHYRKRDRLEGLLRQIKYKTPPFPTAEQIGLLADELTEINRTMAAEWEQNLGFEPRPGDKG